MSDSNVVKKSKLPALTLAALGVVFGDIGTSPLYTIKEVFSAGAHPVHLTPDNIFGILSMIVWALIMVVSVKYVAFIMRADNRGEGGIMATAGDVEQARSKARQAAAAVKPKKI